MKKINLTYFLFIKFFVFCFFIIAAESSFAGHNNIVVNLIPAKGTEASGRVRLRQAGDEVIITGILYGVKVGKHGFHVHQNGNCSDDDEGFMKAGSHFNPEDVHHGSLHKGHTGDLGNIVVTSASKSKFKIKTSKFSLNKNSKKSIRDRAIMIHIDADDEKTDPAGNSGKRILCGVIH